MGGDYPFTPAPDELVLYGDARPASGAGCALCLCVRASPISPGDDCSIYVRWGPCVCSRSSEVLEAEGVILSSF